MNNNETNETSVKTYSDFDENWFAKKQLDLPDSKQIVPEADPPPKKKKNEKKKQKN